MLAAVDEVTVVQVLEYQAGREGPDDRRKADGIASQASTKQNARPTASSTPPASNFDASENSRGER